jgi:hypothetical protein
VIRFRKVLGDTVDRNLIHFAKRGGTVLAGVAQPMDSILDADTVLTLGSPSIDICDLDSLNPVQNNQWGYANFMPPLATFQATNDTLCPGEPFHVRLDRVLNDGYTQYKVCRLDTIFALDIHGDWSWQDTCVQDSMLIDSMPIDPVCKAPHSSPDQCTFWGEIGQRYRITMSVWNDCGLRDDTMAVIYFADSPHFSVWLPDSACPGAGSIFATVSGPSMPVEYTWEITEFPDTSNMEIFIRKPAGTYSETFFGVLPDTMFFPAYHFQGGRYYIISLSVTNNCGSFTASKKVRVPLSAWIKIKAATAYANPVGPSSFELQGQVTGASSFTWSPTTGLSDPYSLNTVSQPSGPVQYILEASDSSCSDFDTMNVAFNTTAFAGIERSLCQADTVMLGSSFDGIMFMGLLSYIPLTGFQAPFYDSLITLGRTFHQYFTPFLISKYGDYYYSGHPYYNFVNMGATRDHIQAAAWYPNYYKLFVENASYNTDFKTTFSPFYQALIEDSVLRPEVDSLYLTFTRHLVEQMFSDYHQYIRNNMHLDVETTWEYKAPDSTTWIPFDGNNGNADWLSFMNLWDAPLSTRQYRLTLIDNAQSLVEYDSVTIFVDSSLTPSFVPAYQLDSTVYLYNTTAGMDARTTVSWDFGDGSTTSTSLHPFHTFPAFDSNYLVCLSVTNGCGTYTLCDTVNVDSNGLIGMFAKRGDIPDQILNKQLRDLKESTDPSGISLSVNTPNPFSRYTQIHYSLGSFDAGSMLVTNPLGQTIAEYKLRQHAGGLALDANGWQDGVHYYSLVVNGTIVKSRMMLLRR